MKPESKLIVALDSSSLETTGDLLKQLEGVVDYYKIGFELFTAHGWSAVELVRRAGGRIFLDLKLHDIPNTVAKTARVICEHGIELFNVHALGGLDMMTAARETVEQFSPRGGKKPKVIAVTILTSHTQETLSRELGIASGVEAQVLHLASLAKQAGLDGVVSSPQEIEPLRKHFSGDFLIVTPGIRPAGSPQGDQKRTFTPKIALEMGASYIVVGRPITEATDPRQIAASIIASQI